MNIDKQITHNVNIFVPPSNWDGDRRKDVEKLVIDTASHIIRLLRNPLTANIKVIPGPIDSDPITLYRSPNETQKNIILSARNREWNKYTYQFAHEFCHVISDHDKLKKIQIIGFMKQSVNLHLFSHYVAWKNGGIQTLQILIGQIMHANLKSFIINNYLITELI